MTPLPRTIVAALILGLMGTAPVGAQTASLTPVLHASMAAGSIQGIVSDASGRALEGVLVSALGATNAVAKTDVEGQFTLRGLVPGTYMLRAHLAGFSASERELVEVRSNRRLLKLIRLEPLALDLLEAQAMPQVLAAGAGLGAVQPSSVDVEAEPGDAVDHPHTPTAWRLRHVKRSVLRDANGLPFEYGDAGGEAPSADPAGTWFAWAVESSARVASALFKDFPFSGELNLLTTSSFPGPEDQGAGGRLPRGVAFLSIGSALGSGDWAMKAALTGGDVSSWIVAGSYAARRARTHAFDVGMSYGTQAYKDGRAAALAALADDSRSVGAVYGYDDWQVSSGLHLSYGARWARYDYVDQQHMFSPRVGMMVSPFERTHVRAQASQQMVAPGAEEFLPPTAGLWLPPERTFSSLASNDFRVERVRTFELALEREFKDAYVIAVRRFFQRADDQIATLFGIGHETGFGSDAGHYFVASAGSVEMDGWGVRLSSAAPRRVRGSIDYSLIRARWTPSRAAGIVASLRPSAVRSETEDIHDVTTSLEAAIPETSTRVFVVYKLNSAFARQDGESLPGLDGRFDVLVNQALPFRLISADWEVLVGVRNLFREPENVGSVYDELLVVGPPTRFVGGVLVRF